MFLVKVPVPPDDEAAANALRVTNSTDLTASDRAALFAAVFDVSKISKLGPTNGLDALCPTMLTDGVSAVFKFVVPGSGTKKGTGMAY